VKKRSWLKVLPEVMKLIEGAISLWSKKLVKKTDELSFL
jgi:hypothetical protein